MDEKRKMAEEVMVAPVETGNAKAMKIKFQVAAVRKPLMSVKRIVEKGSHVCSGPGGEDNYIINKESGDKIKLKPNGRGSYLVEVKFLGGGKTEITVDSGAEENVCPWEWGAHQGTSPAEKKYTFRAAGGAIIPHYGQRDVRVTAPF